ncbi:MAG: spermidine synthase [Pseudonocardiaceae bacterium]|nr:spermidine synthase [Pseudonocardiaceae bacterium]
MPEVVERLPTPRGELVLRRDGEHFEVIANGVFLMDTRDGRSERLLVAAALERIDAQRPRVLVGGLGVGFSLDEALSDPRVGEVTVVEREPAVVRWNRSYLDGSTRLDDRRTRLVVAELGGWLADGAPTFDVLCLDIDNGPDWTVTPSNAELYSGTGLVLLASRMAPGGVLAVWSAAPSAPFEARLRVHFEEVTMLTVDVPRGAPDTVYLAQRSRAR